jgi:hypothetical protein
MFTPAEVTWTGRLLALIGTGLLLADWEPWLGGVLVVAGLACMWRGETAYQDLKWSGYDDQVRESAQREPGGQLRDRDD